MLLKCEDFANLRMLIWRSVEDIKEVKIKNYLTRTQKIKKNYYLYQVFDDNNLICSFYIDFLKETFKFSEVKSGDREVTQMELIKAFLIEILKLKEVK